MSTITREFTKEQLQQIIETDHVQCGEASALARIALASLEAEPVGWQVKTHGGNWKSISDNDVDHYRFNEELPVREVYAAPPAPKSEAVYQVCKEAGIWVDIESYDVFSLQSNGEQVRTLYTATPAPLSAPDEATADNCPAFVRYDITDVDEAWARGFNACRAAMLQGAEPVTTAYKLRDAVETIRNSGIAIDAEKILAERDALNSPVIPDGCVLVPKEITPEMMRAVQVKSELGGIAASELSGAYALFSELWDVAVTAAPKQKNEENTETRCGIQTAPALDSLPKSTVSLCSNSPVVTDGWVMVPVEPTEAMNKAGWAAMNEHDAINPTYRAMIAAAPKQE